MDDLKDKIVEALGLMDAMDDEQWTNDGAPKVDVVADLADVENVKRADIINAAPKFSRENADLTASEPEAIPEPEVANTQGYSHPEIVKAQADYDEAVAAKAKATLDEVRLGAILSSTMDRLMRVKADKQTNQHNIMNAIKSSGAARAARVEQFQVHRALMSATPTKSPLDEAIGAKKTVRAKM